MNKSIEDSAVIIVGAGPIGLTLGMDLAKRGVRCLVIEQNDITAPAHPKCNTTSSRSMEIFRKLGVSEDLRKAGMPGDYPGDVAYATQFYGYELARLKIPSSDDRLSHDADAFDGGWPTVEPVHRISQRYLEPVLREHASKTENLTVLYNTRVVAVANTEAGASVTIETRDGESRTLSARYVVGCDGSNSHVRKCIDLRYVGDSELRRTRTIFLRSSELMEKRDWAPSWMTWVLNRKRSGNVVAVNGKDLWLVHFHLWDGEAYEDLDTDACMQELIGDDFEFETIAVEDWVARRLVAERYRVGNVFVAGDAAHIWIPFAGFGMNAGIEEAAHLGWMLAGVLKGWASDAILDCYDVERRPIGEKVSRSAAALAKRQAATHVPRDIKEDTPEASEHRRELGEAIVRNDGAQFNPIGLNFGTVYEGSPIICYDDGAPPEFHIDAYEPSTVPGCRLPHFIMNDGASLFDTLGADFTLLVSRAGAEVEAFVSAAQASGLPLKVLDISGEGAAESLYGEAYVLGRPDQRIAWRGDEVPEDVSALFAKVTGHTLQSAGVA